MANGSPLLVAFKPPSAGMGNDALFYGKSYSHIGDASHWLEPMRALAVQGRAAGIEFHTADMVDLNDAAVFVYGDAPASRHEVIALRKKHPHLKVILQILESSIGRDWIFDSANHADFDAVLSYNPVADDGRRYFSFRIPAGGLENIVPEGMAWEDRKIACMIAHVPNVRPFLIRRTGIGMIRGGWRFSPLTWWNYVTEGGSLYRERLRIARTCETLLGDQFDIFGPGWPTPADGKQGFSSARGAYTGSKLDLLQQYRFTIAYENWLNDRGYVSEKLFDAVLAGCVPVYLGNKSIEKYVPADVFVDARNFSTRAALVEHIRLMSRDSWQTMRDAGKGFLQRDAVTSFGSAQYIQSVIKAVQQVAAAA